MDSHGLMDDVLESKLLKNAEVGIGRVVAWRKSMEEMNGYSKRGHEEDVVEKMEVQCRQVIGCGSF